MEFNCNIPRFDKIFNRTNSVIHKVSIIWVKIVKTQIINEVYEIIYLGIFKIIILF